MIRNNINFFFFFFFLSFNIYATDFKWSATVNKQEAFVNEAIYLKYVCEFSDNAELYTIELNPEVENELYSIKLFSQRTNLVDGKRINTYEYIAFVKKPIMADFSFTSLMKKTNRDSIENTVLGRDNADYEEFLVTRVKQETIKVDIKETEAEVSGQFSIEIKKDKQNKKAYEPFHLEVKISGAGNIDAIKEIDFDIDGVKVFAQKPIKNMVLGIDGYKGFWSQKFAFVAHEDFIVPAKSIEYFDTDTRSLKTLDIKAINVKVDKVYQKSELLDEQASSYSLDFNMQYIYYILTFITGFLLAKIKFKTKNRYTKDTQLRDKIHNVKSINELSMLLILNNEKKFNDILLELDSGELSSLAQSKKKVFKLIDK